MGVLQLVRRLCHWGPATALCLIFGVTYATEWVCGEWGRAQACYGNALMNSQTTLVEVAWLLWAFLTAVGLRPVAGVYEPEEEELEEALQGGLTLPLRHGVKLEARDVLQYCDKCVGFKKPRAHHCSQCGVCVNKMDHHCPWVNNCVWAGNHKAFTLFTLAVAVACGKGFIRLFPVIAEGAAAVWHRRVLTTTFVATTMAMSFQIMLILVVGGLFVRQCGIIRRNMTSIDEHVLSIAKYHRARARSQHPSLSDVPELEYAYDGGLARNVAVVFPPEPARSLWRHVLPWRGANPSYFPRVDGAAGTHYTLPMEQLAQRVIRERIARPHRVTQAWPETDCPAPCCAVVQCRRLGVRAVRNYPGLVEPHLPVAEGGAVAVTRCEKEWLFGKVHTPVGLGRGGWFPASHAVPVPREPTVFGPLEALSGVWNAANGTRVFHDGRVVRSLDFHASFVLRELGGGRVALLGVTLTSADAERMVWANGEVWTPHRLDRAGQV